MSDKCDPFLSSRRLDRRDDSPDDALLMDARELAAELGVSLRTVVRLGQRNAIPAPVRLGRGVRSIRRWRRREIQSWIDQGCPVQRTGKP